MKLALVFLMVFVATSYQQRFQKKVPWMMPNYDDYYYRNNPLAREEFGVRSKISAFYMQIIYQFNGF